ncbi:MAG: ribonuclease HII, partial [Candidatus Liptonbacteria bacterium]|nr:ribonuclease HII [Candidatus Liptonbacteria bacterium]
MIGIDEVGRGSCAGPLLVAAVRLPRGVRFRGGDPRRGRLRDSKKLTARQRQAWYVYLMEHPCVQVAMAGVLPATLDRTNVAHAANAAALRAFRKLTRHLKIPRGHDPVYLDGGLYLGTRRGRWRARGKTIIRGDEKITAIKVASILAKVRRDRLMVRLAARFPGYGFEAHKGYGTRMHRAALETHGPSEVHR